LSSWGERIGAGGEIGNANFVKRPEGVRRGEVVKKKASEEEKKRFIFAASRLNSVEKVKTP
jgi:hypothetical protein